MDAASKALAEAPPNDGRTWATRADSSGVALTTLYNRHQGRPSKEEIAQRQQYLSVEEEKALVAFLILMSSFGQPVRIKYIPTLAFSIARRRFPTSRPNKPPGKNWAQAFGKRHPELKAKRIRSIDWKRHEIYIYTKVTEWFEVIGKVLQDLAILPENVYNVDETGVMLSMLGSVKVLVGREDIRGYRGAGVKRTMVTAIECISANGRVLDPLVIWPASTHRSNWTTHPTPGWHYGFSENGYNDSKISLEWLTRVFDPQTKGIAKGKPRVLISDGFGSHETLEILEFCFANNIILCRLPSHTSHKLQPCDVSVFAPLKTAYRDQVERLNRGGVDTIGKEHFTYLYKPARDRAITKRNILAGWAATGLFPFHPERVLRDMPKPPAEHDNSRADVAATSSPNEVPLTRVTPVTAEGLTWLTDLIKQDACAAASDDASRQRLQRRVQKLASAAKISFTKQSLLEDHNRLLYKINSEAKVRRSTRSLVIGTAKVMKWEDLERVRVERLAKDKAAVEKGKGKRGRKRKVSAQEADGVEGEVESGAAAQEAGLLVPTPKDKKKAKRSRVQQPQPEPEPWRAPVAQMY
ncbi:DDE superfamily endonuclease [Pyrenophora tritici-repentis]|nr:DDE superfamily endonuclease [Pyrenophora tritici-repentis]